MNQDITGPADTPTPVLNPMVRELGLTRPRLRASLRFSFQEFNGRRFCLVEDPLTSKFHRIGLAEYRFLTYLDGTLSFAEAFARASLSAGAEALNEREATALVGWLVENGLADFGTTTNLLLLSEQAEEKKRRFWQQFLNLLYLRIPVGNPDRYLTRLFPAAEKICGKGFFLLWSIIVLLGASQILWNGDKFNQASEGVLSVHNWLWLGLVWIGLKLIHEFWHGLVCKHLGGEVRETGVMLVCFMPIGYVDATASWRFPSKWQRMYVAAAGMYIEFFIAALAAVVWARTETGLVNTLAFNTIFTASVVTLFFNANPLMRFDGYFLLADYLEIPNLAPRSQLMLTKLAKKYLLGLPHLDPPEWHKREELILVVYGIASFFWKIVVMISMLIGASYLFGGGGAVFALIAGALWVGPPLWKFVQFLRNGNLFQKPEWRALAFRGGAVLLVLLGVLFFPWPITLKAPALVEFGDVAIIRAECPGFVTDVHVRHKQNVSAEAPLITLENEEEQVQLKKVQLKLREQEVRSRMTFGKDSVPEYQAEVSELDSLRKQALEKRRYVDSLELTAPVDGTAIGPHLDSLKGTYIHAGQEIMRIGQWPASEIKIAIPQEDADYYRQHIDYPIEVKVVGRGGTSEAILKRISGRATKEIRYPAMTSLASGPLTVAPRKEAATEMTPQPREESPSRYELVEPCFIGTARLTSDRALDLNAGERAYVKFNSRHGVSLWKQAYRLLGGWLDHLMKTGEQGQGD